MNKIPIDSPFVILRSFKPSLKGTSINKKFLWANARLLKLQKEKKTKEITNFIVNMFFFRYDEIKLYNGIKTVILTSCLLTNDKSSDKGIRKVMIIAKE